MTMLFILILILDKTKGISAMEQKFLEVVAKFEAGTGKIFPQSFIWHEKKFSIDKIIDARPAASLKHGGQGMRYTCRTGNKDYYLFCDDGKWFIEVKNAL